MQKRWELDTGYDEGDAVVSMTGLRNVILNGHRVNVVTGRSAHERPTVFSPPDEPPVPVADEPEDVLLDSANLRAEARLIIGEQLLKELAELDVRIQDNTTRTAERTAEFVGAPG